MLKVEGFAARTGGLESLWLCIILGGVNKVHYGLCENWEYKIWSTPVDHPLIFEHDF